MAIYDFHIGAGPDFVMTKGKVIFPHKAEVGLSFDNGVKSSVTVTNPSLSALIVGIKEKLVAIGWSNEHRFSDQEMDTTTLEVQGKNGSGNIVFKFPEEMSVRQRPKMAENIRRLLK